MIMRHKLFQLINLHSRSFLTFIIIGALSAMVNLGSFALQWQLLHINYLVATSIAYCLSVAFHFTCNRRFTFKSHGSDLINHLKKYVVLFLVNYLVTISIVHLVVGVLHFSPYWGIVSSIAVTVWIGYSMSHFWIFKTTDKNRG